MIYGLLTLLDTILPLPTSLVRFSRRGAVSGAPNGLTRTAHAHSGVIASRRIGKDEADAEIATRAGAAGRRARSGSGGGGLYRPRWWRRRFQAAGDRRLAAGNRRLRPAG